MPSLVRYAHEILSEDRYGHVQVLKSPDRIATLNDSQLAGMVSHLSGTASRARSSLWREANRSVLLHVSSQFESREKDLKDEETRLWNLDRDEREARETSALRSAESAAAERQIAKTAARVAREETETYMQVFRTEAAIQFMHDCSRARTIRSWSWWTAATVLVGETAVLKIVDSNRNDAASLDMNMVIIGFVASLIVFFLFVIGWKYGQAKVKSLSPSEINDLVETKMGQLLVQFHEDDTRRRNLLEQADARETQERHERIRKKKEEKKRLNRFEKTRKTQAKKDLEELTESRRNLFERPISGGGGGKGRPTSANRLLKQGGKAGQDDGGDGDDKAAGGEGGGGGGGGGGVVHFLGGGTAGKKKGGGGFGGLIAHATKTNGGKGGDDDKAERLTTTTTAAATGGTTPDLELGEGGGGHGRAERPETEDLLGPDEDEDEDGGEGDDEFDDDATFGIAKDDGEDQDGEQDEDEDDDPELEDPVLRRKTVDKKRAVGNMGLAPLKRGAVLPVSPDRLYAQVVSSSATAEELLEEGKHMLCNRPESNGPAKL